MSYLPYGCIGRDDKLKKLKQLMKCGIPVVIFGVAGVGKTAFCAYYYKKQKEVNNNFFMLYVDVSNCSVLESFLQSICNAIDLDISADLKYLTEYFIGHCDRYQVIFFDNWEDIQCSLAGTFSWGIIRDFINLLANHGICILLASQQRTLNGWLELYLPELQEKDGRRLFKQLLLRQGKDLKKKDAEESQSFEKLFYCMENHPLTMILTASLVEDKYYNLCRIKNQWIKACNESETERHRSLQIALKMSYDSISNGAKLLWGIISKLTTDFPLSFMLYLEKTFPDISWDEAERILIHRCLIRNTEAQTLNMLMPVKLQWDILAEKEYKDRCLKVWEVLLPIILQESDAPRYTHNPKKSNSLKKEILLAIEGIIQIIESLIENGSISKAEICIEGMEPYFELIAEQGIVFLDKLPIKNFSLKVQGLIYKCKADIIRLKERNSPDKAHEFYKEALICFKKCGEIKELAYVKNSMGLNFMWNYKDVKKALEYFDESEKYSRNYRFDMCLAEVLKNKGVLLCNELDNDDAAQICFKEAEGLYKKIGDYRGLAHVTKRMGVLAWKKGDINTAIIYFEKALFLYRHVYYIQGEADTISRLCLAYSYIQDKDNLNKIYKDGINIFDKIPYEVTRQDLKKNLDIAQNTMQQNMK